MSSPAPGRLGNLTPEQQQKLQELWRAVARVLHVQIDQSVSIESNATSFAPSPSPPSETASSGSSSPQRKASRFGWGRKTTVEEAAPVAEEDKYGQTKDFQNVLANNSPEDLRNAFWKMTKADNPDDLLLRFLRARKWDIDRAMVMMLSTLHWRLNVMNMDDGLMRGGEMAFLEDSLSADKERRKEGSDFLAQLRMGKAFIHGTDRQGRPICTINVRSHKIGAQSETSLEKLTVYAFELSRLMLKPPVDTATMIFDMTGFGLANMDYTPLKFVIKCFEANYPESLGVVLVHKAPWLFHGFWKVIRGWLDPVVVSKIHFTNTVEELEEFIARDHIPRNLGGDEDWEFRYIEPVAGENDAMKDTATRDHFLAERAKLGEQFEESTIEWLQSPPEQQATRMQERIAIADRLKENYWQLDPYVRARSQYDRNGLIGPGGKITFYDAPKEVPQQKQDNGWKAAPYWVRA